MFEDKDKSFDMPVSEETNVNDENVRAEDTSAHLQEQQGESADSLSPEKKEKSALTSNEAGNGINGVGENANNGVKAAVPYVKKEERQKMAKTQAAAAAAESAAKPNGEAKKADSPIPPKTSAAPSQKPTDGNLLLLDFSDDEDTSRVFAQDSDDYPYGNAFAPAAPTTVSVPATDDTDKLERDRENARLSAGQSTAERMAREEEKKALLAALAAQKKREDDAYLDAQRHGMRMSAGKGAYESNNPAFAQDYLKTHGAVAAVVVPQNGDDVRSLENAEGRDSLRKANEEIGRDAEDRKRRSKKQGPDDDFFEVVENDGKADEDVQLTGAEEKKLQREKERQEERADRKKRRFVMHTGDFDDTNLTGAANLKNSLNDKPLEMAVLEDYLAKRFAAMRTDNARLRSMSERAKRRLRKKEKSDAINDAVASLSTLGITDEKETKKIKKSISAARDESDLSLSAPQNYSSKTASLNARLEKARQLAYTNEAEKYLQSIEEEREGFRAERQAAKAQQADERRVERAEKKSNPERYLSEYEKEILPALEIQAEGDLERTSTEAKLTSILLALDEARNVAVNTQNILKAEAEAAEKAANTDSAASIQAMKRAKIERDRVEKIKGHSDSVESLRRKAEREALREERKAGVDARNAVMAEAVAQMKAELLEEITAENENRIFALTAAEAQKSAESEKQEAERIARVERDSATRALAKAEDAENRLARAQARLMLPITRAEKAILEKESRDAAETQIRCEREAVERSESASIAEIKVTLAAAKVDRIEQDRLERSARMLAERAEVFAKEQENALAFADRNSREEAEENAKKAREEANRAFAIVREEAKKAAAAAKVEASIEARVAREERIVAERAARDAKAEAELAVKNARLKEEQAIVALHSEKRQAERQAKDAKFIADRKAESALAGKSRAMAAAQKELKLTAYAAGVEDERLSRADREADEARERAAAYAKVKGEREARLREKTAFISTEEVLSVMDTVTQLRERRLSEIERVDLSVLQIPTEGETQTVVAGESGKSVEKTVAEQKRETKKAKKEAAKEADKLNLERSESRKEEAFALILRNKLAKQKEHIRKVEVADEAALREDGERMLAEAKDALEDAIRNAEEKSGEAFHPDRNERLMASLAKRKTAAAAVSGAGFVADKKAKDARIEAERMARKAHKADIESARAEAEVKVRLEKTEEIALANEERNAKSELTRLLRELKEDIADAEKTVADTKRVSEHAAAALTDAKSKLDAALQRKAKAKENAERVLADRAAFSAKDEFDRADRLAGEKAGELDTILAKLSTLKATETFVLAKEAQRVAFNEAASALKQSIYRALVAERVTEDVKADAQEQAKAAKEDAEKKEAVGKEKTAQTAKAAKELAECRQKEAATELTTARRAAAYAAAIAKDDLELVIGMQEAVEQADKGEKASKVKALRVQKDKSDRTAAIAEVENERVNRAEENEKRLAAVALHVEEEQLMFAEAETAKLKARAEMEARRLSDREVRLLTRMARLTNVEKEAVLADAKLVADLSVADSKKKKQKDLATDVKKQKERKEVENTIGANDAEEFIDLYLQGKRFYPEINDSLREFTSPINNKVRKFTEKLAETAEEKKRIAAQKEELQKFVAESTAALDKEREEHRKAERLAEDEIVKAEKLENTAKAAAERAAKAQAIAFLRAEEAKHNFAKQTEKDEKTLAQKQMKEAVAEAERTIRLAEEAELLAEKAEAETRAKTDKAERLKKENANLERRAQAQKTAEYAKLERELSERYAKAVRAEAATAERKAEAAAEAAEEALKNQNKAADKKERDLVAEKKAREAQEAKDEARLVSKRAEFEADFAEAKAREMAAKVERLAAEDAAKEARLLAEAAEKAALLEALKAKNASVEFKAEAEKAKKNAEAEAERAEAFARQEEEKAAKALKTEADAAAVVANLQSKEADRLSRLAKKVYDKKKKREEADAERAERAEKAEKAEKLKKAKEAQKDAEDAKRQVEKAEKDAQKAKEKAEDAAERSAKAEEAGRQRAAEFEARSKEKAQKEAQKEAEKLQQTAKRVKERIEKEAKLKAEREALLRPVNLTEKSGAAEIQIGARKAETVEEYFYDYVEQDQKSKAAAKAKEWEMQLAEEEYKEAEKLALEARKIADAANKEVQTYSESALETIVVSRDAAKKVERRATKGNVNSALVKERKAAQAGELLEKSKRNARRAELSALKAEAIAAIRKDRVEELENAARTQISSDEDQQTQRLALAEMKEAEALARSIRKDADKAEEHAKVLEENYLIAETRLKSGIPGVSREELAKNAKEAEIAAKEAEKQAKTLLSVAEKADVSLLAKQAKVDRIAAAVSAKAANAAAEKAKVAQLSADLKAQALSGDEKVAAENALQFLTAEVTRAERFAEDAVNKAVRAIKAEAEAVERSARAERLEADRLARLATAEAEDARKAANAAVDAAAKAPKEEYAQAERTAKYAIAEAERREDAAKRAAENAAFRSEAEKDTAKDAARAADEASRYYDGERKLSYERAKIAAKKMAEKEASVAGVAARLTADERQEFFNAVEKENRRINDAVAESKEQARRQANHIESRVRNDENAKRIEQAKSKREEAYRNLLEARKERQDSEHNLKKVKAEASFAKKKAQTDAKTAESAAEADREETERIAYFSLREAKRLERVVLEEEQKTERAAIAVSLAEKELAVATAAAEAAWETEENGGADDYTAMSWNSADKRQIGDLAKGRTQDADKTTDAEQFLLSYAAKDFLTEENEYGKGKSQKSKADASAYAAAMPSLQDSANSLAVLDALASGDMTYASDKKSAEVRIAESYFEHVVRDMLTEIDFLSICLEQETAKFKKQKGDAKMHAAAEIVDLERAICEKYFDILGFGKEKNRERDVTKFVPKAVAEIRRFNSAVKTLSSLDKQKHAYASLKIPGAILDGSAYRPMISPEYGLEESEREKQRNLSAHAFHTDMSVVQARYNYRIAALNAKARAERYTFTLESLNQTFGKKGVKRAKKQLRARRERALKAELLDNERYENVLNADVFTTTFKKRNVDRARLEQLRTMLMKALAERDELNRKLLTLYTGEEPVMGEDTAVSVLENGKVKNGKRVKSYADVRFEEIFIKARKKRFKAEWKTGKVIHDLYLSDKTKNLLISLLNRKTELSAIVSTTDDKIRIYGWRGAAKKQAIRDAKAAKRELKKKVIPELRVRLRRAKDESRTRPGIRWFH